MGVNVADLFVSMSADLSEFDRKFQGMQATLTKTEGIVDQYGRRIQSTVQPIDDMAGATDRASVKSNAFERQLNKLTSGTDFVAGGIRRLRSALEAIVWGTIIGAVAGLISKMTEWALATKNVQKETDDLLSGLNSQLNILDPMRQRTEEFTQAQYKLAKAQFLLNQEMAKAKILEIVDQLQRLGRVSEGHLGVLDGMTMIFKNLWNVLKGDQEAIDTNMANAMKKAGLEAELLGLNLTTLLGQIGASIPTYDQFTANLTAAGGKFGALNKEERKGLAIAIPLAAAFQTVNGAISDNVLLQENLLKVTKFLIDLQVQQDEAIMTGNADWQIRMRNLEREADAIQEIARVNRQWLDDLNRQIILHDALAGSYGPVLQKMALQNEMFKSIHEVSQGLGQAVGQWIVYGQNFRDSMVNFFRQWAAQSIAEIIRVQTQLLIMKAIQSGLSLGVGGTGGGSGAGAGGGIGTGGLPVIQQHEGGMFWEGAPRFHEGIGPDEYRAVLKRDEGVFTKGQMEALGGMISQGPAVIKQKIQFIIPAMDGASVERVLRSQAGTIQDIIGKSVRQSRTFARELS